METVLRALRLRTNPFSPECNLGGRLERFDYTAGPLTPEVAPHHLAYYFDVYEWSDTQQVGKIGPNGRLETFPTQIGRPGMIVVISGFSGTGRTSLINLLLYEIKARASSSPLITNYPIVITRNRVQDAKNFASNFLRTVTKFAEGNKQKKIRSLPGVMQATFTNWKDNLSSDEPNTDFLFQQLAIDAQDAIPSTPIVFSLDATDYMNTPDTWRPTCTMLRNLANYIILSLSNRDHAVYILNSLTRNNFRIVWIDAPRMDIGRAKRFLMQRLSAEREGPPIAGEELFPFTDEALAALFSPTTGNQPVPLAISVAIRKLKGAFEKKLAEVAAIMADPNRQAQQLPPSLSINGADMTRLF
jgi:hypothetical protein